MKEQLSIRVNFIKHACSISRNTPASVWFVHIKTHQSCHTCVITRGKVAAWPCDYLNYTRRVVGSELCRFKLIQKGHYSSTTAEVRWYNELHIVTHAGVCDPTMYHQGVLDSLVTHLCKPSISSHCDIFLNIKPRMNNL